MRVAVNGYEWVVAATEIAERAISGLDDFTTEDIWEALDREGLELPPHVSPRAMSKVITTLLRKGLIRSADKAPRPHRDARGVGRAPHPVRVWEVVRRAT
jgi:hypothetical protein